MAKAETVHDVVFKAFELEKATVQQKETVRKYVNNQLKLKFPQKKWVDLSEFEKEYFVFISIKDEIIKRYLDPSKQDRINAKLKKHFDEILEATIYIREYNEKTRNAFRVYYKKDDTDDEKKTAYNQFCKDLLAFNEFVPIPSFDDWIKQNNKYPLRIYDYYNDFAMDINNAVNDNTHDMSATQSEINHIVLQALLYIVETEHKKKIDVSRIEECIKFIKNFNHDEFDEHLIEFDPSLPTSENEQKDIIIKNLCFEKCKKLLREPKSFIIDLK